MWLKMVCTWTGISKDVKEHLHTAHKELCEDYNAQHLLLLPRSNDSLYTYKFLFAFIEIFCFRLIIQCGVMYFVLHYIGAAKNDLKYQYKIMVSDNEDTESVVVTHLARSFTGIEDQSFFPKNCLKLHCDHLERFKNKKGKLPVLLKILRFDD